MSILHEIGPYTTGALNHPSLKVSGSKIGSYLYISKGVSHIVKLGNS